MKVKELLSELKLKESYNNFIKENPDAYFCSAMLIQGDADKLDLNFFIPSKNKISSFAMPFGSITNHDDEIKEQHEQKELEFKVDLDNLSEVLEKETKKKPSKIIAILQRNNWNVTTLNGLDMCRFNIDALTGKFEQKDNCSSLSDMIKFQKGNRSN